MVCSYKWVTIYTELFTIAVWIDVPNSHLPSGSLRGWLLAIGEGRQKYATKSGLASNWCGIWMHYLKAELGSAAHSGAPVRSSWLTDSEKNGLVPTLQPGQNILGLGAVHQMMFVVHLWKKPCHQQRSEKQQVDNLCPCPKSVPGCPNLTRLGAPLFAVVSPSRPLLHPRQCKYSTARPAVQPLPKNSPKSHPENYLALLRQDLIVQTNLTPSLMPLVQRI